MSLHPIYRCRRAVLAHILIEGGEPRPDQWRSAALEPFDQFVPPWGNETDQRKLWPSTKDKPQKFHGGPQF